MVHSLMVMFRDKGVKSFLTPEGVNCSMLQRRLEEVFVLEVQKENVLDTVKVEIQQVMNL